MDIDDFLSDAGDTGDNLTVCKYSLPSSVAISCRRYLIFFALVDKKDNIFDDDLLDDMDLIGLVPSPTTTRTPAAKIEHSALIADDPMVHANGKYACNHKCKDKTM